MWVKIHSTGAASLTNATLGSVSAAGHIPAIAVLRANGGSGS
jgi:hypothetical protein